jgi:carbamoyltransferase
VATAILGISAFYHDSAAALIIDGEIVAAAQEERFTRIKHDANFPVNAIKYVLEEAGLEYNELSAVAFYDKPMLKFERLLETYHAFAPKGLLSFIKAMPVWLNEKLFIKKQIRKNVAQFGNANIPLLFPEHHLSHAASAYYPSPFNEAAILTIDGVGEWATTTICHGEANQITILKELHFPHSVGLLYSAFTYYLGFKVNSGEYKLMGLAPYGNPCSAQTAGFKQKILSELVDVREDGSIILNMQYFDFATKLTMTNDKRWESLFGVPRREPGSAISQTHMNFALAAQEVTEAVIIALVNTAQKLTKSKNLVMAGGVALNCVANSKIAKAGIFDDVWIQPAAGDAGGSLGAAYAAYYTWAKGERKIISTPDAMKNAYLGPQYNDRDILSMIRKYEADYLYFEDFDELTTIVSQKIADGKVIGWFQSRMEFGPRALGNRSIIGDPRNPAMQKIINVKIKNREEFRPFAPSVLLEDVDKYFDTKKSSPYMLFVASIKDELRVDQPGNYEKLELHDRLYRIRSAIQAVTHVDYSARIQTVTEEGNARFYRLINSFKKLTGCSVLINTSFNLRGEPIVCTPQNAYRCFMHTEMDFLVIGNFLFDRKKQKLLPTKEVEQMQFLPD